VKQLLCLAIALTVLTPACAQEPPMHIRCEMSIAKSLPNAQPAELVFTLTNVGEDLIHVLNWQTPFEGIKAPMFTVRRDGVEVEYRGPMLKRGAPRREQYLVLKPGERREAKVNLADGWEVSAPGRYTIEYSTQLFDVIAGTAFVPRSVDEFNSVTPSCGSVAFLRTR
jgi:hypothetical protein